MGWWLASAGQAIESTGLAWQPRTMVHGRAGVIGLAVAVFVVAIASSSYATYLEKAAEQAAQAAAKAAERAKDLAAQKAERRRIDKEERERGWNKRRKDQWVNDDFDMPMLQVIDLPPPHEARLEPLGDNGLQRVAMGATGATDVTGCNGCNGCTIAE